MTDTLSRNIFISIGLHIAVVILIFVQAVLVPRDPLDLRNSIRVDVVGLPEKITEMPKELAPNKPEPAKPEPKPKLPPKPATMPAPEVKPLGPQMPNPKAKKLDAQKTQEKILKDLKNQTERDKARDQALDKIKESLAADKQKEAAVVLKGNEKKDGSDLTGLSKIAYSRYIQELKSKVHSQYTIPEWMAEANLKAQVQVFIDERGYVTKRLVVRTSNNMVFDKAALDAVDASSPLPVPPEDLRSRFKAFGVYLNFPE